jgi:hypothetical protein
MYSPSRISPSNDPREVQTSIRLTKRVQFLVPLDAAGLGTLQLPTIMQGVPGGNTFWSSVRVSTIELWAPADANTTRPLQVTTVLDSSGGMPPLTWMDSGTQGSVRPKVGFKLGLLDQARWFSPAATFTFCTIKSAPVATSLVGQATVELLSPALVQ